MSNKSAAFSPLAICLLLTCSPFIPPLAIAAVERAPEPPIGHWIWDDQRGSAGQTLYLHHAFQCAAPPVNGRLLMVADFHELTLWLNGHLVTQAEPYEAPQTMDVTRWLRHGRNVIAARASSTGGPAALVVQLEIQSSGAPPTYVVSNDSWRVSRQPDDNWLQNDWQPPASWKSASTFGKLDDVFRSEAQLPGIGIGEADDYTQWKQALDAGQSTDPASFLIPDGYEIQLLRSAEPNEGSWVSLEFDPRGRLIVAREQRGLLRMQLPSLESESLRVEVIDDSLLECRGLLYTHGALYVNANNSKTLYRLRDTDGDDQFDERTALYATTGGVGHGRNDLTLGPDGKVYVIHGDDVDLPRDFVDRTSPFREQRQGAKTREGHLLRFDADGRNGEVIAAGLRNPYGIDFHRHGDAFTYDADAEFDMGAPWYRPTRVDQLVSGADFGWRGVTGSWPPYVPDHPDNARPTLDIGKGSPTGVKFGYASNFPQPHRDALYILDWAYGRIVAVHLSPRGAGYAGRAETFVRGRPLNVTDLDFGPDGAMYFVTGGRKTQSGLYRLRYTGIKAEQSVALSPQQEAREQHAAEARALRSRLEAHHAADDAAAIDAAWPFLDSSDPLIRHAARIAIEHQSIDRWQQRALDESRPRAAVQALLALARHPQSAPVQQIAARLHQLPLEHSSCSLQQEALYTFGLCLTARDQLRRDTLQQLSDRLEKMVPHPHSVAVNRELCRLLVSLEVPSAVEKTLALLQQTTEQSDRLHYLFTLRQAKRGWTDDLRRQYFIALREMRTYQGGEGMPGFITKIESDALSALVAEERKIYEPMLARDAETAEALPSLADRPIVQRWQLDDFSNDLHAAGRVRDFLRGERMYRQALCIGCHRVGLRGAAIGPDLTALPNRFSRQDILKSILHPDLVVAEQYRRTQIATSDGRVLTGQVLPDRDYRAATLRLAVDPLRPETIVEIPKTEISEVTTSTASVMPNGLLDTFTRDEILDLLAWLEAAGDARHPNFAR